MSTHNYNTRSKTAARKLAIKDIVDKCYTKTKSKTIDNNILFESELEQITSNPIRYSKEEFCNLSRTLFQMFYNYQEPRQKKHIMCAIIDFFLYNSEHATFKLINAALTKSQQFYIQGHFDLNTHSFYEQKINEIKKSKGW
jgi:hypothetical protein